MATATNPLPYGGGMTKREIFATAALQGLMARDPHGQFNAEAVVREAIEVDLPRATDFGNIFICPAIN